MTILDSGLLFWAILYVIHYYEFSYNLYVHDDDYNNRLINQSIGWSDITTVGKNQQNPNSIP